MKFIKFLLDLIDNRASLVVLDNVTDFLVKDFDVDFLTDLAVNTHNNGIISFFSSLGYLTYDSSTGIVNAGVPLTRSQYKIIKLMLECEYDINVLNSLTNHIGNDV